MWKPTHTFLILTLLGAACLFSASLPGGGFLLGSESSYNPREEPAVRAVSKALPSVVSLTTESTETILRDPFAEVFKDFQGLYRPNPLFQQRQTRKVGGFGSGVVIDPTGYIVSNHHTIKDKKDLKILVTLANGEQFPARIIAVDSQNDLALLKIDSKLPLPAIGIADSDELMLGQTVLALGNPFGLDNTVTRGIVSAKSRNVKSGAMQYDELIQTDAAINPGNSGGALIDLGGRLVGVNVLVLAKSQGISFAIPSNKMIDVLTDLIRPEKTGSIHLGLRYEPRRDMIRIRRVEPGSSADGLIQPGDRIVSVDGAEFFSLFALQQYLVSGKSVGERVRFMIERAGKVIPVEVILRPFVQDQTNQRLGLSVQALPAQIAQAVGLGEGNGLLIGDIREDSVSYQAGIRRGMILAQAEGRKLENPGALEQIVQSKKPGATVTLDLILLRQVQGGGVFRQDARVQVAVP